MSGPGDAKDDNRQIAEIVMDLQNIIQKHSLSKCTSKPIPKVFNDPVHGHIELHPLLVKMIDTPQFQRLRHLKQLGLKYLVFPGATHTRFAHSIGVSYLAGCLLKRLQENQPGLGITERDCLCVQIAALCHDLGHGPFSRLFDSMFISEVQKGTKWQHGEASIKMFDWMRENNGLDTVMKDYELKLDEDIPFIEDLIIGRKMSDDNEWTAKGRPESKSFLYEVVANKVNGIDVDKWDYLARDCHYLGIPNGFDHQRLLNSARVCKVNGRNHICFRDKVADNVYGMFHTRYTLHRQVLQHKTGYIIDIMVNEALLKANDKLWPGRKISDAKDNMLDYVKLTDHLFDQILNQSEDLGGARGILDNIVNRCLPKFVGEARLDDAKLNEKLKDKLAPQSDKAIRREVYQEEMKNQLKEIIKKPLNAEDFEIYVTDLGFGEVRKDPIENVHFYSKNDPDTAFKMEKYQMSRLKPTKYHEYVVRVYYKKTDGSYKSIQQAAHKGFHEWCRRNELINSGIEEETEEEETEEEETKEEKTLTKVFNDSVYGQIELDTRLVQIIDTPEFQRLRHIKQLGGADLVYPGATHTRFEHSLGMAYLAGLMISMLKENQMDLDINDKDILCVKIAALCYNLGHGPFSHVYERYCTEALKRGENWKVASKLILADIVEKNPELSGQIDLPFINELIDGVDTGAKEWTAEGRSKDKAFLYEIVLNKWNGIDVRKWDYFARDCHHLGIPNSFDYQRLLKSARVCRVKGTNHICFRDKVADNVYDMFRTQHSLYNEAYKHKVVYIIEQMITEALSAADGKITKISSFTKSSSQKEGQQRTSEDHIFEEILYSSDDNLKDARMKLENIVRRRLPKCVGETRMTEDELKEKKNFQEEWNGAVDEWNKLQPDVLLDKKDFSIETIKLYTSYKKDENPISNVYFYRKWNPLKAFKIKKYEVSSLLPIIFSEYVFLVWVYKPKEVVECAKKCNKWSNKGKCKILVYGEEDFEGNRHWITEDTPSLDRYDIKGIYSCEEVRGNWELCEGHNYREPKYQLEPGREYHNPQDWSENNSSAPALSLRHEGE